MAERARDTPGADAYQAKAGNGMVALPPKPKRSHRSFFGKLGHAYQVADRTLTRAEKAVGRAAFGQVRGADRALGTLTGLSPSTVALAWTDMLGATHDRALGSNAPQWRKNQADAAGLALMGIPPIAARGAGVQARAAGYAAKREAPVAARRLATEQRGELTVGPTPLRGEGQKLTGPEIASRPWFRGDAQTWAHDQLDPTKLKTDSLFGPGLYLSDSGKVAASYLDKDVPGSFWGGTQVVPNPKRAARMAALGRHTGGGDDTRKLLELARQYPDMALAKALRKQEQQIGSGKKLSQLVREAREQLEEEGRVVTDVRRHDKGVILDYTGVPSGHVKSYSLADLRGPDLLHETTPFTNSQVRKFAEATDSDSLMHRILQTDNELYRDAQGGPFGKKFPVSQDEIHDARQAARQALSYEHESGRGARYVWNGLKNVAGFDPIQVNELFKAAGLKGMQYQGGVRSGGLGSHNAMALFDPTVAKANPSFFRAVGSKAERAAELLGKHKDATNIAAQKAEVQGARQGGQIVGDYNLQSLYDMAKVYAKDALGPARRNEELQNRYMAAFIHAAQSRQLRSPANG